MTRHSLSTDFVASPGQCGFSLVEMAVVMVILGLLLGGLMMPLSTTLEQTRRSEAKATLKETVDALYGFAAANGRLPCPATPISDGREAPAGGGDCTRSHGFVPARTLGLNGSYNADTLLRDPWNNPYRYMVSQADAGGLAGADFTTSGDMAAVGMAGLLPDLVTCTAASASATHCAVGPDTVADQLVALVYSQGRDWAVVPNSADQTENGLEATLAGYRIGSDSDRVFVHRDFSDTANNPYDDLLQWVSPHVLYTRLIAAEVLP